jgi:hypothetical protein
MKVDKANITAIMRVTLLIIAKNLMFAYNKFLLSALHFRPDHFCKTDQRHIHAPQGKRHWPVCNNSEASPIKGLTI